MYVGALQRKNVLVVILGLTLVFMMITTVRGWNPLRSSPSSSLFRQQKRLHSLTTSVLIPDAKSLSPIERVFVSATGSLQRMLSAYYNREIHVKVLENSPQSSSEIIQKTSPNCMDTYQIAHHEVQLAAPVDNKCRLTRKVQLLCNEQVVCEAVGCVWAESPGCAAALSGGKIGVGQLIRSLGVNPDTIVKATGHHQFSLDEVQKRFPGSFSRSKKIDKELDMKNSLWRQYEMRVSGEFGCAFVETFVPDFLEWVPQ